MILNLLQKYEVINMNYYISDLHFFHKNVTDEGINFDNRPFKTMEEIHETIKENWSLGV